MVRLKHQYFLSENYALKDIQGKIVAYKPTRFQSRLCSHVWGILGSHRVDGNARFLKAVMILL